MSSQLNRPEFCTNEMLTYLDDLRASGDTNMFGAARYLDEDFGPELWHGRGDAEMPREYRSSPRARDVLMYWMRTFGEANR